MNNKKILLAVLFLTVISLLVIGCAPKEPEPADTEALPNWRDAEFTDVATGKTFKVSDFKGKPVLLESFAVWCPQCTQQQRKIRELHQEIGDAVISISIDTDPNEDESTVQEYLTLHGFNWFFAVSPVDVTRSIIDEFGIGVVNAPAAPVVLVCKDQSARLLGRGVKSAAELKLEIEKGC